MLFRYNLSTTFPRRLFRIFAIYDEETELFVNTILRVDPLAQEAENFGDGLFCTRELEYLLEVRAFFIKAILGAERKKIRPHVASVRTENQNR